MPGSAKFTGKISAALENGAHVFIVITIWSTALLLFRADRLASQGHSSRNEEQEEDYEGTSYLLISRSIRGL